MRRIGILSDTHGHWDERYVKYFSDCDEIWHAGDIGSLELADRLAEIAPLRSVYGNIDGAKTRREYDEVLRFRCEEMDVMIKHIGGHPGHYDRSVAGKLYVSPPDLFVAGHSHILKIEYDKTLRMLFVNPGAAGTQGWHKVRTLVRLTIEGKRVTDAEVIELAEEK